MPISQERSRRKPSGGRVKSALLKKKMKNKGNTPTNTILGSRKIKQERMRGGALKTRLLFAEKVTVYDPKTKKHSRETIKNLVENPANAQYVRRNLITKGSIVETGKGKVKITSRPGQTGSLNGVLV